MRRFHFNRKQDVSGVSGTGTVCEGIEFSDGKCAVRWLTPTASTEIWDSVDQALRVHGHSGATVIEWDDPSAAKEPIAKSRDEMFGTAVETINLSRQDFERFLSVCENPPPPNAALKKAMREYRDKYLLRSEVTDLVDTLTKAESSVYVSGDADNMGNKVARVEEQDDEAGLKEVSRRINAGQELFKRWIERLGGEVVEQGGDEFLGKIASIDREKLEAFREAYQKLVGATLTMGVGGKISQATRARLHGKLSGKDQLVMWSPEIDADLRDKLSIKTDEVEKLHDAGFTKAQPAGPGSRGGQVIGTTIGGHPIYSNVSHPAHEHFTALDHYRAATAHSKMAKQHARNSPERLHHLKQQVMHTYRMSHLDGSDPHWHIPNHAYKELQMRKPTPIETHFHTPAQEHAQHAAVSKEKTQEIHVHKAVPVEELIDVLEKAGKGAGSRGGKISGYDKYGHPIYKKFPIPKHFSIISGQHGGEWSHEKHANLHRDLQAAGFHAHHVHGASGRWGYDEPNYIVRHNGSEESQKKLNEIGKKHGQDAVFHRTGNKNRVDFTKEAGKQSLHGEGRHVGEHSDEYTHWPDGRKIKFPVG